MARSEKDQKRLQAKADGADRAKVHRQARRDLKRYTDSLPWPEDGRPDLLLNYYKNEPPEDD